MTQIKKIQSLTEEASDKTKAEIKECEVERYKHLVMIGNVLHPSVPISNDEVCSTCVCGCLSLCLLIFFCVFQQPLGMSKGFRAFLYSLTLYDSKRWLEFQGYLHVLR